MSYRNCSLATLLAAVLLQGCDGGGHAPGGAIDEAASSAMVPSDPVLASVYNRSCRSCHTVAATGAPLTGDRAAWSQRLEKGMPTLVDNTVNGFGGMPPLGMCMDCTAAQFEALILFMARGDPAP